MDTYHDAHWSSDPSRYSSSEEDETHYIPAVVTGVKSTFVDWGDESFVPNIGEDTRAKDDVKEFKYSQLEFVLCIFDHFM